jgi:uncharacterized OsmC-like protein
MEGVLEAHEIPVESVTAEVEGDVEKDAGPAWPLARPKPGKIPLLTQVRVHWHIVVPPGKGEITDAAVALSHRACTIVQSLEHGIDVDPSWEIEEVD